MFGQPEIKWVHIKPGAAALLVPTMQKLPIGFVLGQIQTQQRLQLVCVCVRARALARGRACALIIVSTEKTFRCINTFIIIYFRLCKLSVSPPCGSLYVVLTVGIFNELSPIPDPKGRAFLS